MTPRRYGPLAYVPITRRPKRDAAQSERAGAARHGNRRASLRDRPAASDWRSGCRARIHLLARRVWRATGWEIVQDFLAHQSK